METIELNKLQVAESLIGTSPIKPVGELIDKPCTLVCEGSVLAVYDKLSVKLLAKLRSVGLKTKTTKGKRLLGLPTSSSVFGSLPRNPVRNDYCRLSANSIKERGLLSIVQECSREICELYSRLLPVEFSSQKDRSEKIPADWKIDGTPFTTVNFNKNTAIKYHRDKANQKSVFSSVIIIRDGVSGGELALPEYGVSLSQKDGFILLFDGQKIIHGVCPIRLLRPAGYRLSVVLYAMQQIENCYPFERELQRAKTKRTEKESRWRPTLEQLGPERGLGKIE